jgi:hypothetical protein
MDGYKKQKMVNLVWRPISTQTSSVIAEAGNEVQEVAQCSKSSDVSKEVIEGETASVVSAGKHSVSLEVLCSFCYLKFLCALLFQLLNRLYVIGFRLGLL